jgi:xanthine dehydrogenase accessory factor
MAIFGDGVLGTIGGGKLEFEAIAQARDLLAQSDNSRQPDSRLRRGRFPLGPSLGQCCGGVVELQFELVGAADVPELARRLLQNYQPVALFGGGHVGTALARILATLPFSVTWIDSRDDVFPEAVPANIACQHSEPVQGAVRDLAPQSMVLIMSFSHAEDLDIVAACLKRLREHDDLLYVGLIGSKTKWAKFRHRLEARGFTDAELSRVTCPIGIPGVVGKEPEVIAVAVAAQLLLQPGP